MNEKMNKYSQVGGLEHEAKNIFKFLSYLYQSCFVTQKCE